MKTDKQALQYYFTFLVIVILNSKGTSQDSFDYFANSPEWYVHESYGNPFFDPNAWSLDVAYTICGDTLIDDQLYHKVHRRSSGETCNSENLHHFIRQEGFKVYGRTIWENEDLLLADYDYQVGDTLQQTAFIHETMEPIVESIDSLEINGNFHRIFNLTNSQIFHIIEGIGSETGSIIHVPFAIVNGSSSLRCHFQNDVFQYSPDGQNECGTFIGIEEEKEGNLSWEAANYYPNPVDDILYIQQSKSNVPQEFHVYAPDGRLIKSGLTSVSNHLHQIDLSDLETGNYILMCMNEARWIWVR